MGKLSFLTTVSLSAAADCRGHVEHFVQVTLSQGTLSTRVSLFYM